MGAMSDGAEAGSAGAGKRPGWGTAYLLVLALAALLAGLVLPALSVKTFWVFADHIAILQGIMTFFREGQAFLGALILVLSVVFPIGKILFGLIAIWLFRPESALFRGVLGLLSILARWSMTDVFLLALVVLVLDGQIVTAADLRLGAAAFATGVVLSSLGIWRLESLARAAARTGA
ncbi:MAG: paraquat-inducible protein A [Alphaproteobacteria bacterium]|nr:paraquat-inducible protein A [Alphaproteobacteria bacterium]